MGVVTIYGNKYKFEGLAFRERTLHYCSRFVSAQFRGCGFDGNIFKECDFSNASVYSTSYKGADFEYGRYEEVIFDLCDFSHVCFEGCIFKNSFFTHCKFTKARFINCIFINCMLRDCQLGYRGDPTFYNGEIIKCEYVPYIPMVCPESGPIIGYKKAAAFDNSGSHRGWIDVIVKLEIPEDAKRSSALGRKCRCDKARVLGIYDIVQFFDPVGVRKDGVIDTITRKHIGDKLSDETVAYSKFAFVPGRISDPFPYKVGQWVYPDEWDDNRFDECSHGIHFFVNAQEAIDY